MIEGRRPFGRTIAIFSLLRALMLVPLWIGSGGSRRRRLERAFFGQLAQGFGLTIRQNGPPVCDPGTLLIMNHISWADIVVMMAILDADFVARGDMARWPVIGWLARRFDPVFVARDQRHGSIRQVDAIRDRLRSGRSVILCAEGTTSDGTSILPFRTSLFAAANAACAVQPVVLRYLTVNGERLSPARQREVAWIGDDDLPSGAMRLAIGHTLASVEFLPPLNSVTVRLPEDRKAVADDVRQRMLTAYVAVANRLR